MNGSATVLSARKLSMFGRPSASTTNIVLTSARVPCSARAARIDRARTAGHRRGGRRDVAREQRRREGRGDVGDGELLLDRLPTVERDGGADERGARDEHDEPVVARRRRVEIEGAVAARGRRRDDLRAVVDQRHGGAGEWLLRIDLHHLATQRLRGESWRRGAQESEGASESSACGTERRMTTETGASGKWTGSSTPRTRFQILPHGPYDGHRGTVARDTQLARGAASTID